jgi:tripartite-type tricarboxylate transporter receptor subunit TctC
MNRCDAAISRRSFVFSGTAGVLAVLPFPGIATASFPSKPLRFVVPFNAGSSSDILARSYAKVLGEVAGQTVTVENKGGADGIIAARAFLALPADGYSIMFASNTLLSTNAVTHKDLPYDPLKDFDPISVLQVSYAAVAVPGNSRFQTIDDLVDFAKKNPGALSHGSGSTTYTLWNAWLTKLLGIKVANIPYKDSGGAAQAIAGGQVDFAVTAVTPLLPLVESGRARILLYTGDQRHPQLPKVPTAREAGVEGYEAIIWNAVAVKAGTPKPIRDRIVQLFEKAARSEQIQLLIKPQGYTTAFSGPDAMRAFLSGEIVRWKKLVADTDLKFE